MRRGHRDPRGARPRREAAQGLSRFLGFDLGGTNIRTVVADASDTIPRIVGRDDRPTPTSGADAVIAAMVASARAALDRAGTRMSEVQAAGCSAPGPLDHRRGLVHVAPNINGFVELPLGERLRSGLGCPSVFVDRDTAMAAIAERMAGAGQGVEDMIYITVSTGLGGAIVSGGRMIRGTTGTAGEIGHWPVALEGPRCGCGSYGCAESFAAGRNLAEQYGVDRADRVFQAAERGDERAAALIRRASQALANLGIGLVNGLNPAVIVVGGSVAEHQPDHVLGSIRRGIDERAFAVPAKAVRIVPAALGADVGTIGAVLEARERAAGRGEWFL